ncbi:WhiB family transcriptional regulator [Nocardia jinanensis]|uniref:4Fe-4S Wbl-type domain-containing protein n=1 Tax=Nocardia jinanensis TaxID=382504 RepID=A0A917VR65_9NOCA|nr:WhiB family transcriptional regulator [Nocardia jinanensis]GGL09706.1 hypothetical protein GCM10011588_25120 [Nocardia jinanensis]
MTARFRREWAIRDHPFAELIDQRLTGAACAGRAPLFDTDPVPGETDAAREARYAPALKICRRCPVQDQCATAAAELGGQALGVWAGIVHAPPSRGRPKKASES